MSSESDGVSSLGIESQGSDTKSKLPCRIKLVVRGAEWFVYNRTPVYDHILAQMTQNDDDNHESENITPESSIGPEEDVTVRRRNTTKDAEKSRGASNTSPDAPPTSKKSSDGEHEEKIGGRVKQMASNTYSTVSDKPDFQSDGDPDPLFLRFLPVYLDCTKAAIVLGNEHTKSVFVVKAEKVSGEIDASGSRAIDQYRQLFNFEFDHPVVQIKPNEDYKEDQAATATRLRSGSVESAAVNQGPVHKHSFFQRQRRKIVHKLQDLVPYFQSSVDSLSSSVIGEPPTTSGGPNGAPNQWQGLSRYLDENEQDDKARWSAIEYATVSTIVDSPSASMCFYWDVPGKVPDYGENSSQQSGDINGDIPPEYGLDLVIREAVINYGPWADRQRTDIQKVFFPSLCKDSQPAPKLKPGAARIATVLKLYFELQGETILRVPIREESKNWKWKKQADTMGQKPEANRKNSRKKRSNKGTPGPEIRPFGWLDIKVASDASINYVMDMVAGPNGYSNKLELDLPQIEISTSVNHALLLRSFDQKVSCDLSNPLRWNGAHDWQFDIVNRGLELFILREHVFLITDLVDDWSSGPPPEYLTFSPIRYLVNLRLSDARIYLNANDSNIINNPTDFDDNTFLILFMSSLNTELCIPADRFRPHKNTITFDVGAKSAGINLHTPPWNTQATFLTSTEMAQLTELSLHGKYQYCATTSTGNTDTLWLDIYGLAPSVQFYGFLIRYFLKIRDNYFGLDIHFKTLEEYQQVLRIKDEDPEADITGGGPYKKSNDLDVVLSVAADESSVILPSNLYCAKKYTRIDIASLGADMRFTNYYMDLDVFFNSLAFSSGSEDDGMATPLSSTSSAQMFIDGLNVYGHRLFGLPPTEPTYVCNWDLDVGSITGECSTDFLSNLIAGGKNFGFSFDDDENALPSISELPLHDITFLRASIQPIKVWLHIDEAVLLFSTGAIDIRFDDWASNHYSKKMNANIPSVILAIVDEESASRRRSKNVQTVETNAFIETSISFTMISRKQDFSGDKALQQEHVRREDQRTHRTEFLLREDIQASMATGIPPDKFDPPAMCFPPMPLPLEDTGDYQSDVHSTKSAKSSFRLPRRSLRRKSSFLSVSGSSQHSVVQSRSGLHPPEETRSRARSSSRRTRSAFGRNSQRRDFSVSTGRQSSFYSAIGDHGEKKGFAPTSVAFSSSYIAPYFPLADVEPDTKDVPDWLPGFQTLVTSLDGTDPASIDFLNFSEDTLHTSFIVQLDPGIRAFLNPRAVQTMASLMSAMQTQDPETLLDNLQMDCMNEIFNVNKKKSAIHRLNDFSLRIPAIHARFANASSSPTSPSPHQENDQYDAHFTGLVVTTRAKAQVKNGDIVETSALNVHLHSAHLSAKERFQDLDDTQAAVSFALQDFIFWMVTDETISANVSLKGLELATASNKVEYLASLIHRTSTLATVMADNFAAISREETERLQLFLYHVARAGQQSTDPLFLTRPSYVLRSAPNHLRLHDSWKVMTRLRHMYTSLNAQTKSDISNACLGHHSGCPEDTYEQVLACFDQWRSWDMNNLRSCLVIHKVWGKATPEDIMAPDAKPVKAAVRIGSIRFTIDPGPKQNEIVLLTFTTNVASNPPGKSTNDISKPVQSTSVQIYCVDAAIHINWELLELAEDVLKLVNESSKPRPKVSRVASTPAVRQSSPNIEQLVHVVVATEKGSITIDTINLHAVSISKGLRSSFVVETGVGKDSFLANTMIAAEAATTKMRSRSQELTLAQLRNPSIYVSKESQTIDDVPTDTWKLAANSEELSYIVRQDTLAIMETLDLLIGDEVAQLNTLTQRLPKSGPEGTEEPKNPKQSRTRLNVACFLNMYHISMPLLPSLRYNISGVIARASLALQDSDLIFDFDIKENSHDITTQVNGKGRSISLLQLPPTNGRISGHSAEKENIVQVFISTEPVGLDAAAIHSLLTALNRPEISSVVSEVRLKSKAIQTHLEEIFGPKAQKEDVKSESDDSKLFVYDAHLTFAGLDVFADAPGRGKWAADVARLSFKLGSVQIKAANRLEHSGPILQFPEVHVGMRHIMFDLSRWTGSNMEPCANFGFAAFLTATTVKAPDGEDVRSYQVKSDALEINLFAGTATTVVDVLKHFQERIKDLDLSRERHYLRKLSKATPRPAIKDEDDQSNSDASSKIFGSNYAVELLNIQISWIVGTSPKDHRQREDLVLSINRIDLSTRKENSARLTIEDFQLQMVPTGQSKAQRTPNSVLVPEVIFNVASVSTTDARRLAFQAAGKVVDIRMTSQFIIPAAYLKDSIVSAAETVRVAAAAWHSPSPPTPETTPTRRKPFFGKKRMESCLVDADFAGAIVHISGKKASAPSAFSSGLRGHTRAPSSGKYGQFTQQDATSSTVLRSPGLAWKVEYKDNGIDEPALNAEVKIDASSNTLYPTVVPLILEITSTIKEIVSDKDTPSLPKPPPPQKLITTDEDQNILTTDPSAVLGRTRLNLGVRICRQEFSLSCQPIARVAATTKFQDIYMTFNTVRSSDYGNFFAISASINKLQASCQHVYSRESTGSFDVDSIVLSLMNSKHVSGTSGLSAILNISPMKVLLNAKQSQDFLLFREIWVPPEARQNTEAPITPSPVQSQAYLVQRYQQVAATAAFPWTATVSIAELDVQIDMGQAIGKSAFMISKFWISSKKNSDWEQNLCLGFDKIGIDSTGRMSGYVTLQDFRVRTSIEWPAREKALNQTPLVQCSLGFSEFKVKASFDYQAFLIADITTFNFMMYNVRSGRTASSDRLVAMLDGDAVHVFCTTNSASQGLALYQAFERLVQEKKANYEASLKEIERFMKRVPTSSPVSARELSISGPSSQMGKEHQEEKAPKSPISLHTDVVVMLKAVNIGAFPNTFTDHQIFKLEALNAQARFAVSMSPSSQIHSGLGLTLGQLRIALSSVKKPAAPSIPGELSVEEVVAAATGSRGGTILKVPKLEATMQTWQTPESTQIDYIFKSKFEGKVEVGWNYSRISFIRSMWETHSQVLASRLGKPLPPSAVKIRGVPGEANAEGDGDGDDGGKGEGTGKGKQGERKITAEVNVPMSKYEYRALEEPVIETPQLRDMGEATPPLEWIGLHRERLPNLTHQIVIVGLLGVASEVEDAYAKILGSS